MEASPTRARFSDTRWSLVARAGGADELRRREALEDLAGTYWPPLYAYLRARGRSAEDAADLVQGLFARLLEGGALAELAAEGGRFRSWLLTCLVNHERTHRAAEGALKRGGGAGISIDTEAGERLFASLEADGADAPEALYERAWAMRLLAAARTELEREHLSRGRGEIYRALIGQLDGDGAPEDRAALREQLGLGPVALRVALHRLRTRYRELILAQVRETLEPDGDGRAELDELLRAVSGESRNSG